MTTEVLNQKYAQLTGIRKPVSEIIEAATTTDEKKATYEHLMWHIKNGVLRTGGKTKELVDAVIPALAEALEQPSTAEVIEDDPTKYTVDEANAYNRGLQGAWAYGRQIKPTKEECNAYNQEHFENYGTENGPWAYDTQILTPAVEEVLYTTESAAEHNATLTGALTTGVALTEEQVEAYNIKITGANKTIGDTLSEEEAAFYNATLEGAVAAGAVKTAGKDAEYYADGSVTTHNSTIEGAYTIDKVLGTYTDDQVNAHNATLPGAVKAGDNKPAQTNDNQEG